MNYNNSYNSRRAAPNVAATALNFAGYNFSPRESREQAAVFDWARLRETQMPELKCLFAVPNGGRRDAVTGARLKREGVKAGVPDMLMLVARGHYHGLAIELKRQKGGALSQNQRAWINRLNANGYRAVCCSGAAEAIKEIESYLKLGYYQQPEMPF